MKYFSAFAAGFDPLVARYLAADFPDAKIETLGGAVVWESAATPDEVKKIKYFKNSFIIAEEFPAVKNVEEVAARAGAKNIRAPKFARTFGIVFGNGGELVQIDGNVKAALVDRIAAAIKLKYRATAADVEFQIVLRNDGRAFLLQRITRAIAVPAGELEPATAAIIARATEPAASDVFIDPFCGGGSIPLARAAIAPFRGIFACDLDARLRAKVRAIKNARIQKSFFVKSADFFENKFDDNFADAIATDPPWGGHQKIDANFYDRAMTEFGRILKPGGRLAILISREIVMPANDEPGHPAKESPDIIRSGDRNKIMLC